MKLETINTNSRYLLFHNGLTTQETIYGRTLEYNGVKTTWDFFINLNSSYVMLFDLILLIDTFDDIYAKLVV